MTDHESIEYPAAVENTRVEYTRTMQIGTSPGKVFPLACPVEELRWVPNWEYQLVYTRSGVNEDNCIFTEQMSGLLMFGRPVTTTWNTTLHDPDKYRVQFLLLLEDKAIIKWELSCRETGVNTTTCTLHLIFTALDDEANELKEDDIEEKLMAIPSFLFPALKHYCETGRLLSR